MLNNCKALRAYSTPVTLRSDGAAIYKSNKKMPVRRDWRDKIRIGDIIVEGNTYRTVRHVTMYANKVLRSVDLSIRRCSWTGRCYTVIDRSDLHVRGFRPTKVRVKLSKKVDRRIRSDIVSNTKHLDCCDVETIF